MGRKCVRGERRGKEKVEFQEGRWGGGWEKEEGRK